MNEWIVQTRQLTKKFPGAQALREVDLAIPPGSNRRTAGSER